jgi:hypothetical protein
LATTPLPIVKRLEMKWETRGADSDTLSFISIRQANLYRSD